MPSEVPPPTLAMSVQIDRAGSDDVVRHVAHIGFGIGLELASDHGHLAAGEGNIRHGIELLGGGRSPGRRAGSNRRASLSPDMREAARGRFAHPRKRVHR